MKIESVSLRHVDPSCGRLADIRTSKGTVRAPCQIVNHNELSAMLAENVEVDSLKLIQIQTTIDRAKLRALKTDSKYLNNALRYLDRRCGSFELRSCVPRLGEGIIELSAEDLSFLVSMQLDAHMDLAYYPYEQVSAPRFAGKLDMLRDENPSQEITPILDLDESSNVFKSKFRHLIDSGYSSVGLWYQGLSDSRSNLFYVKHKAHDLQMWMTLSNYPRKYSRKIPASFTHLLPWHGIDSYVKRVDGYPSYLLQDGEEELPPRAPESVSFLGRKTYGILSRDSFKADMETLGGCACERYHGSSVDSLLHNVNRAARMSKIHSLLEGERMLEEMKTPIRESRLSDFLKHKKYPSLAVKFDTLDTLTP